MAKCHNCDKPALYGYEADGQKFLDSTAAQNIRA
jgi:hypothetical protein